MVMSRVPSEGPRIMDRSDEDRVLEYAVVIDSAFSSLGMLSEVPDVGSSSEEFDKGTGMPVFGTEWSEDGSAMFPGPSTVGPGLASREEGVAKLAIRSGWSGKGNRLGNLIYRRIVGSPRVPFDKSQWQ